MGEKGVSFALLTVNSAHFVRGNSVRFAHVILLALLAVIPIFSGAVTYIQT